MQIDKPGDHLSVSVQAKVAPMKELKTGELLTIGATAERLGLNKQTVYRWIRRGWIEALPLGPRRLRISSITVDYLLKNGLPVTPDANLQGIGKPRSQSRSRLNGGRAWR